MSAVNYDHTKGNVLDACGCKFDKDTIDRIGNVIDLLNELDTQSEVVEFVLGNLADEAVRCFVIKTFLDGLRMSQKKEA